MRARRNYAFVSRNSQEANVQKTSDDRAKNEKNRCEKKRNLLVEALEIFDHCEKLNSAETKSQFDFSKLRAQKNRSRNAFFL